MANQVPFNNVVIHPLVLLSVVDHYNRSETEEGNRVCGILLGEVFKGKVDVTNSYAVPFEEDVKNGDIWFFDHNYHESMYNMFHKVSAKEKVIGWYSTGPQIRKADIEINELIRRYTPNPVFVIVDVNPQDELEIPTQAYFSIEDVPEKRSVSPRTFMHIPSEIGAYEAEEVGVEHLVREIRDIGGSTVADLVANKINSLKGMKKRLATMDAYLTAISEGKTVANHQILYNIQNIFNSMPNMQVEEIVKSFRIATNDHALVVYVASLIRSVMALHDLINNKLRNNKLERKAAEQELEAVLEKKVSKESKENEKTVEEGKDAKAE